MKALENTTLQRRTLLGSAISSAVLAACGGGGGGDSGSVPVAGDGGLVQPVSPAPLAPVSPAPPAPVSVSKAWQSHAQLLEVMDGQASQAQVAINSAGQGCAVWCQKDGALNTILACHYNNGNWQPPVEIVRRLDSVLFNPQVVVHANGDASVIWGGYNGAKGFIEYNYLRNGLWLETTVIIEPQVNSVIRNPALASSGTGRAMAIWQADPVFDDASNIQVIEFAGDSYVTGSSTMIATGTTTNSQVSAPQIAMASDGTGLAVWTHEIFGTKVVMAKPYVGGAWSHNSQRIDNINDGDDSDVAVAVGVGRAVVVWSEGINNGANKRIMARRAIDFQANSWNAPELIQTDTAGDGTTPQVTLDAKGNATVVWKQAGLSRENIAANRFDGVAWLPQQQSVSPAGLVGAPQIASDASGNAMVVWQQVSSSLRNDIFASRLDAATPTQWSVPELIEKNDSGGASLPQIAMNANGRALAVWLNDDGPVLTGQPPPITSINANVFK
jgi:hypothetical protein